MKKKTKYVMLGVLRDEKMTGYQIKKCIDKRMSFFWQESYGQIYPELSALLKEGMIKEVPMEDEKSSRREKIGYEITEKGISEFNQWMEEENEKDTIRSEALLKVFLATDENVDGLKHNLEIFKKQNIEKLEQLRGFEKHLKQYINMHNNHKYIMEVLSLGMQQYEMYSEWSSSLIEKLEKGKL